jgi:hypothetical protein
MTITAPSSFARVGVLFDQAHARSLHARGINTFQFYIGEILAHAGLPFHWIDQAGQVRREDTDILIVALAGDDNASAECLWQFAAHGGCVIGLANIAALAGRIGYDVASPMATGYALLPDTPAADTPLRFLAAAPWTIKVASEDASTEQIGQLFAGQPGGMPAGAAIVRARVGAGVIERWAVDPAATVVVLQQGLGPVTGDGVPAPDGSGAIDEGILKADDGFALDWTYDRQKTATGQPYFAYPYADLWREAFINRLLRLSVERGLMLPFLDYLPAGLSGVALISHDSDLNDDDSAITTLGLLHDEGIYSTWCIIEPGYSPAVYAQVQAQGHELAFHYNSVEHENYKWDAADFARQFDWLKQATGLTSVASNKNHYTRFEGWGDLFRWLESAGIAIDQTRGPSKRGNVGMLFGACHPFFPIAWHDEDNRLYDVLEMGFLTQDMDLGSWADSSVIVPFVEQVQRVRGVAHFLFHPVHLHQQEAVRGAFHQVIAELRRRGFPFWTSRQVNDWERTRRMIQVAGMDEQGHVLLKRSGTGAASSANVVIWAPDAANDSDGTAPVKRFGVWCRQLAVAGPLYTSSTSG